MVRETRVEYEVKQEEKEIEILVCDQCGTDIGPVNGDKKPIDLVVNPEIDDGTIEGDYHEELCFDCANQFGVDAPVSSYLIEERESLEEEVRKLKDGSSISDYMITTIVTSGIFIAILFNMVMYFDGDFETGFITVLASVFLVIPFVAIMFIAWSIATLVHD